MSIKHYESRKRISSAAFGDAEAKRRAEGFEEKALTGSEDDFRLRVLVNLFRAPYIREAVSTRRTDENGHIHRIFNIMTEAVQNGSPSPDNIA